MKVDWAGLIKLTLVLVLWQLFCWEYGIVRWAHIAGEVVLAVGLAWFDIASIVRRADVEE